MSQISLGEQEGYRTAMRVSYAAVTSLFLLLFFASSAMAVVEEYTPPPMTEGMFPCSNCHASMPVNRKKRELKEEHADIKLHHAETMRWCLDCHDAKNRDRLRLYNGDLINFTESYRLCGECHGPVFRDWRAGIHGKRTGYFTGSGKRTYYLCAHCHDPHEPKFKPLKPEPPPYRPMDKDNAR
jgi:uncharacterized CHY-type Zn-finger protein